MNFKRQYIINKKGEKKSVILDIREFKKMMQVLEDSDDPHYIIIKRQKEKKTSLEDFVSELKAINLV